MNKEVPNKQGNTALLVACLYSKPSIIEALLKAGANKEVHNHRGDTPLLLAEQHESKEILRLLQQKEEKNDRAQNSGEGKPQIHLQSPQANHGSSFFQLVWEWVSALMDCCIHVYHSFFTIFDLNAHKRQYHWRSTSYKQEDSVPVGSYSDRNINTEKTLDDCPLPHLKRKPN